MQGEAQEWLESSTISNSAKQYHPVILTFKYSVGGYQICCIHKYQGSKRSLKQTEVKKLKQHLTFLSQNNFEITDS